MMIGAGESPTPLVHTIILKDDHPWMLEPGRQPVTPSSRLLKNLLLGRNCDDGFDFLRLMDAKRCFLRINAVFSLHFSSLSSRKTESGLGL